MFAQFKESQIVEADDEYEGLSKNIGIDERRKREQNKEFAFMLTQDPVRSFILTISPIFFTRTANSETVLL